MIRYGSVCSGVEAASLAWEPLGWIPAWFSEIDSAANGVLAHLWPSVPNLGDMLELNATECSDIDVLVGGTPCQSFSVAGLRKGLDDERGNLTLSFVRLAETIDAIRRERKQPPLIIVWENVPGVFSDSDNAFGCFLGALAGEDDQLVPSRKRWTNAGCVFGPTRIVGWRVLNAQYFGVPQRRRRVFVVASARKGFDPREVLFEPEGMRGDPQTSTEEGEEAPGHVVPGLVASGRGVARAGESRGQDPVIPVVASTIRASDGHHGHSSPRGDGSDNLICTAQNTGQGYWKESEVGETLRCCGKGGESRNANLAVFSVAENQRAEVITSEVIPSLSTPGGKPGMGYPCIAFSSKDHGGDAAQEVSPTLRAGGHDKSHPNAGAPPAIVYQCHGNNIGPLGLLRAGNGNVTGGVPFTETNLRVCRLLPVECERLQGMPDGHTARTTDKELADGSRYKLIGNSMAVPVMRWIGRRIGMVLERRY